MYLKKEHFENVMLNNNLDPRNFDKFKRLSSKAVSYSTGSKLIIVYVNTIVFNGKKTNGKTIIELNNGGWETQTTKKWINYGLDLLKTKRFIFQNDWKWYLGNSQLDWSICRSPKNSRPFSNGQICLTI